MTVIYFKRFKTYRQKVDLALSASKLTVFKTL